MSTQFDAEKIFKDLGVIANKHDTGARIVILSREPIGNVQVSKKVTFGIIVAPNNEKLVNALVRYGLDSKNEVEFAGSYVNLQTEALLDVLQVTATINYKG